MYKCIKVYLVWFNFIFNYGLITGDMGWTQRTIAGQRCVNRDVEIVEFDNRIMLQRSIPASQVLLCVQRNLVGIWCLRSRRGPRSSKYRMSVALKSEWKSNRTISILIIQRCSIYFTREIVISSSAFDHGDVKSAETTEDSNLRWLSPARWSTSADSLLNSS